MFFSDQYERFHPAIFGGGDFRLTDLRAEISKVEFELMSEVAQQRHREKVVGLYQWAEPSDDTGTHVEGEVLRRYFLIKRKYISVVDVRT